MPQKALLGVRHEHGQELPTLDVIRYVEGNLTLDNDGGWWALFRLSGKPDNLLGVAVLDEIGSLLATSSEAVAGRMKILSLAGRAVGNDHRGLYLALRLLAGPERTHDRIERGLAFAVQRPTARLKRNSVEPEVEALASRLGSIVSEPATPEEVLWLQSRGPYRTLGGPPIVEQTDDEGQSWLSPAALREAVICESGRRHLTVYSGGEVSYQSFLAVSDMPAIEEVDLPGTGWARFAASVDMCLDFSAVSREQAERRGATPGSPLLDCQITLGIAASSTEALQSVTEELSGYCRRMKLELATASWLQLEALVDFVPVGRRRLTEFLQPITHHPTVSDAEEGENRH